MMELFDSLSRLFLFSSARCLNPLLVHIRGHLWKEERTSFRFIAGRMRRMLIHFEHVSPARGHATYASHVTSDRCTAYIWRDLTDALKMMDVHFQNNHSQHRKTHLTFLSLPRKQMDKNSHRNAKTYLRERCYANNTLRTTETRAKICNVPYAWGECGN